MGTMAYGITTGRLTLATYNTVQISKMETQIAVHGEKRDHLVDVTKLDEAHFKSVNNKVDKIGNILANLLQVILVKLMDFQEEKIFLAVAICKCSIHTAYNIRLAPEALHYDAICCHCQSHRRHCHKEQPLLLC